MHSVYALCDPRTGKIRYIGQTLDIYRRYAQHLLYERYNPAKGRENIIPLTESTDRQAISTFNIRIGIKQIQELLKVSEHTVLKLLKRGELKGFKVGREWRFEPSDIDDFIERQRRKAEEK